MSVDFIYMVHFVVAILTYWIDSYNFKHLIVVHLFLFLFSTAFAYSLFILFCLSLPKKTKEKWSIELFLYCILLLTFFCQNVQMLEQNRTHAHTRLRWPKNDWCSRSISGHVLVLITWVKTYLLHGICLYRWWLCACFGKSEQQMHHIHILNILSAHTHALRISLMNISTFAETVDNYIILSIKKKKINCNSTTNLFICGWN